VLSFEAEMREGGTFREVMSCDGERQVAHGVYRRIVPEREVVFTHQWEEEKPVETLVRIAFRATQGATEIVLRQTGFRDAAEAAGHAKGWSSALARFALVCASRQKKPATRTSTRAR
jgi:glutathione S-transferase